VRESRIYSFIKSLAQNSKGANGVKVFIISREVESFFPDVKTHFELARAVAVAGFWIAAHQAPELCNRKRAPSLENEKREGKLWGNRGEIGGNREIGDRPRLILEVVL